jgi:predicted helicase
VENDLIPRLNGFELLMTSYAMAHLKMDILLTETGYTNPNNKRFKIFLTNSLEEAHENQFNLFTQWLSQEANEANAIKKDTPVMCVIGNPPYSGESANKGEWIMKLMEDYKKEPGGKEKLKEQNSKFINDDYVKFIRFAQHFIEKNGEGILAFINPHGFLDNPTFRGMRWNLLKTFDKIYTIDLHGNTKKNETALDGSIDQNVFDIMQGVSINILVKKKTKNKSEFAEVFNFDLLGKRDYKYKFLDENSITSIPFLKLSPKEPMLFFVPKDSNLEQEYNIGFQLTQLFQINSLGLLTKKDKFITDFTEENLLNRLNDFIDTSLTDIELAKKYDLKLKDNDKWDLTKSRLEIQRTGIQDDKIILENYRCFDKRFIYYDGNFVARLNTKVLKNIKKNYPGLISTRQLADNNFNHVFITDIISDQCYISNKTKEGCQVFPLAQGIKHTYIEDDNILAKLADGVEGVIHPLDIFDYIYAVLHSPSYREKYKEFLKIDFPRVPYPTDADKFWKLVALGKELREIHLLESPKVEEYITGYPEDGDNIVGKPTYKNGSVYINETQYFSNVPEVAWNFYIGGYQPAQKWLKDRKDRELSYDDILHYQKIIVALTETARIMGEIDEIEV